VARYPDKAARRLSDARLALRKMGGRLRKAKADLDQTQQERESAIREADEAGMSRRAIADEVGVSYGRVEQILKKRR
jgi:hypothetical protein